MTSNAAIHFVRTVAAFGLPGSRPIAAMASDDPVWPTTLEILVEQRLTGLAAAACASGGVVLDAPAARDLAQAHRTAMADALRIEALVCDLVPLLADEGFDWRVHKGPAVARLDYPDPTLRSFGDLDFLVRGDQFDAVITWFERGGARRRYEEPRPGFTARFGKGVCVELPSGLEVDVHRALVAGPFGVAAAPDALWDGTDTFLLGPLAVPALAPSARLIGAATHAVLGRAEPRLVPVRDVAQMLVGGIDADATCRLAADLGVSPALARGVLCAVMLAPDLRRHPLVDWAFTYEPTRAEIRRVGAYVGAGRSYRGQVRAGLAAVPGVRSKAAYARALAMPDRQYLAGREGGYRRRLVRALRSGTTGRR